MISKDSKDNLSNLWFTIFFPTVVTYDSHSIPVIAPNTFFHHYITGSSVQAECFGFNEACFSADTLFFSA